jgi:predicted Zn-dependent protease
MRSSRPQLDPQRLMQAVEAALHAAKDVQEHTGGPLPYPADLMGSPLQPDMLAEFTKFEIEEASEFLVRLGEIAPKRKAG